MSETLNFSGLTVLIIGDIMIDRYLSGRVERMSPEAPVPILDHRSTDDRLGGAANVALNIHGLGAHSILLGVTGEDEGAKRLPELLKDYPQIDYHFIAENKRKTTVKTRVIADDKQLVRVDIEDRHPISRKSELLLLDQIIKSCKSQKVDAIILQDYNKGVLTPSLIKSIILFANDHKIPTVVDPKEANFFAYHSCTIFKPNRREIEQALSCSIDSLDDLDEADKQLRNKLHHKISLITLSSKGIYYNDVLESKLVPPPPREIADVCGAGDGVISIVTLAYLKGMTLETIAHLSNIVGGQICQLPGVAPANLSNLIAEWKQKK